MTHHWSTNTVLQRRSCTVWFDRQGHYEFHGFHTLPGFATALLATYRKQRREMSNLCLTFPSPSMRQQLKARSLGQPEPSRLSDELEAELAEDLAALSASGAILDCGRGSGSNSYRHSRQK